MALLPFSSTPIGRLDTRYVKKAGDTMTGNLNLIFAGPNCVFINTSTGQFSSVGFQLYNNNSSFGNNGGVHMAVNVLDTNGTHQNFAIDQFSYTGGYIKTLLNFDLNNATAQFPSTTVQATGYLSSDGTAGLTQASTTTVGKSITVKNGLITAFA